MSIFARCVFAILLFSLPALAGSSVQGIPNFHQVDSHVCRGAQPTEEGFRYLAKIGVKIILDLRESGDRSAREAKLVTSLGMRYVNVPMAGLAPPTKVEITKILALLEDNADGAVFVHCMRGADRTGVVIAAYRIDHNHWDNASALEEARACGMAFFQIPRQNYIRNFRPLKADATAETQKGIQNRFATPALAASISQ